MTRAGARLAVVVRRVVAGEDEDEDDGIMILRTRGTPALTLAEALSCEWRAGDAW